MNTSMHPRKIAMIVAGLLCAASSLVLAAPVMPVAVASIPAPKPAPLQQKITSIPKHAMSTAECAVWDRERSFAQSVETHDAVAFAEHLREDTVFGAGTAEPTRGRDQVVAGWSDIIAGKGRLLRWYPDIVTIGGNPNIALSHGVSWLEDYSPTAKQRFFAGSFNTIWQRDPDGTWRVLLDWVGTSPVTVSAEDLAKLKAALPMSCLHM